jgi:cytochrome c biogenesis protein CcmG, thiol:disulfide interchange protein DsbE
VAEAPATPSGARSRRPILIALLIAVIATVAIIVLVQVVKPTTTGAGPIQKGSSAPEIAGTTLDGTPFRLEQLRGHPVVVNFWGPSCVPCRSEFPMLKAKLEQHAADGLVVVGVLTDDPADLARQFVADEGATWATVEDPNQTIKGNYRVVARPQSYFIDRDGVLRSIQIGEMGEADFERQFDQIKGGS